MKIWLSVLAVLAIGIVVIGVVAVTSGNSRHPSRSTETKLPYPADSVYATIAEDTSSAPIPNVHS